MHPEEESNYFVAAVVVFTVVVFAVVLVTGAVVATFVVLLPPLTTGSEPPGCHVDGECHCAKGSSSGAGGKDFTILVDRYRNSVTGTILFRE